MPKDRVYKEAERLLQEGLRIIEALWKTLLKNKNLTDQEQELGEKQADADTINIQKKRVNFKFNTFISIKQF